MCNFSSNILVHLALFFLFGVLLFYDAGIIRYSNVDYDALVLFSVYQYCVGSPGLDFAVRLNGKVPQKFYGSSFDNWFWLVLIPFLCDIKSILFRD